MKTAWARITLNRLKAPSASRSIAVWIFLAYLLQLGMAWLDWDPRFAGSAYERLFALSREAVTQGLVWQLGTYLFLHGPVWHLAGNLLGFLLIAPEVERIMGRTHFHVMFWTSGLMAGMGHIVFNPYPVVGASGAIFGVLGALAALMPRSTVFVVFLPFIRFPAWFLVPLMFVVHMAFILKGGGALRIAYETHLVGMAAGLAYIFCVFIPMRKKQPKPPPLPIFIGGIPRTRQTMAMPPGRMRAIVDKALFEGMDALSDEEFAAIKMVIPQARRSGDHPTSLDPP